MSLLPELAAQLAAEEPSELHSPSSVAAVGPEVHRPASTGEAVEAEEPHRSLRVDAAVVVGLALRETTAAAAPEEAPDWKSFARVRVVGRVVPCC